MDAPAIKTAPPATEFVENDNVATVNAFKKGKLEVTILSRARARALAGRLCELEIINTERPQKILCRINRVDMTNAIHASEEFQQAIADSGSLPYYSGDCDILTATVELIACLDGQSGQFSSIVCPPQSGTLLRVLHTDEVQDYMAEKQYYAYVGYMPDEPGMYMAISNRNFGTYSDENGNDLGGYGEAKHQLICGQNGSGKTVLALTNIACQLAAHPNLGCLIPDTAGDISRGGSHSKGDFRFNFIELLQARGRSPRYIKIEDVRLTSKTSFRQLLAPVLRKSSLSMNAEKSEILAERVAEDLFERDEVTLDDLSEERLFDSIIEQVGGVYTGRTRTEKQESAEELRSNPALRRAFLRRYQDRVLKFFQGGHSIDELVKAFLKNGQIILLNMAVMSQDDQHYVMYEIFSKVRRRAEQRFKAYGETQNGLIVLDEGPRWAPERGTDDVTKVIKDAFNTTRKLGVGWTIITQRLTAIAKDIVAQCHTKFIGKGMGIGADRDNMRAILGDDGLVVYDQLSLRGGFFWLVSGHQVNYGVGEQYMAFETFGGNATQAIVKANPHIWRD